MGKHDTYQKRKKGYPQQSEVYPSCRSVRRSNANIPDVKTRDYQLYTHLSASARSSPGPATGNLVTRILSHLLGLSCFSSHPLLLPTGKEMEEVWLVVNQRIVNERKARPVTQARETQIVSDSIRDPRSQDLGNHKRCWVALLSKTTLEVRCPIILAYCARS